MGTYEKFKNKKLNHERSEFGVQMDHKSKNHTMLQLEGASKTSSVKTKQIKIF